ncbi:MAG: gamma-glutamylcyclotransferase [Lautropia sp.]|nr:gamma-glutamylcyclotransferase [Lautropia sp.]
MHKPRPSPLTREFLLSGAYMRSFVSTPQIKWWNLQQITSSLDSTLAACPAPGNPVWVFAYGSLIWNPLIHIAEHQQANISGWRRSFCMKLTAGRGSPEHPGRMLALARCPGTSTTGIAFRLHPHEVRAELLLIWMREMIGGTYIPLWHDVQLADGRIVQAITFVMEPHTPAYEPDASIATVAPMIATASGHLGHNIDYLLDLDQTLAAHHIHDPYVSDLIAAVRAFGSDI